MTGNYKDYALMWYDDPYEECLSWFWESLGEDETLPKEFLEYLTKLADDVLNGRVETKPMTLEDLERLSEDLP